MAKQPPRPDQKWTGEVDRLLQQLDPEPTPRVRPKPVRPGVRTGGARRPHGMPAARPSLRPLPSPLGVWARTAPGAILTGALTAWPYGYCGLPLVAYLGAVGAVLVAGVWAAHAAWRRRMARAHTLALLIMFSAAALAALQVLPGTGASPLQTLWRCTG